ncbi:MAG: ATP-dependent DNA helicase, partial [Clostridia bacterium]|nr:ATP-dependent DNA helicase [Clostridia bacterium]
FRDPNLESRSGLFSDRTERERGHLPASLRTVQDGRYRMNEPLSVTLLCGALCYELSGRADGVMLGDQGWQIELLCRVRKREWSLPPSPRRLAELRCYAYALAACKDAERVEGRLTMFRSDSDEVKTVRYAWSREELRTHLLSLLERISWRGEQEQLRVTHRLPSAAQALFPYPTLREGQEWMIREGFSAIRKGKRLFAEAPTGIGKTMSALFPAVLALGQGYADRIFYLTPKASTGREAYRAAAKLFETGAKLRAVMLTAKEQICMCGAKQAGVPMKRNCCQSDLCEYAAGYYERIEKALQDLITHHNGFPRSLICEAAARYRVCPYELSLDLSELCDIVICDYNYAFDPSVYLRRYFGEDAPKQRMVFLVDEAHDLAERARDMYSARLCRSDFERTLSSLLATEGTGSEVARFFDAPLARFSRFSRLCGDTLTKDSEGRLMGYSVSKTTPHGFLEAMEVFRKQGDSWLFRHESHPAAEAMDALLAKLRKFLTVSEYVGDGFLSYAELYGGDASLKLYCLDPSPVMNTLLSRACASILFSATLTPMDYVRSVLGGQKGTEAVSLPSPYDPDRLCVAVADYISTRLEDRKKNTARMATALAATVSAKAGNYIAYFPSYACMEEVLDVFVRKYPKVEIVVQKQGMTHREKDAFLSAFQNDEGHLRIGFCVLGGLFAEGVDLPGSRLIGSVIFGVGLPGLSNERNMMQEYFEGEYTGQGYDYAYTFPGMNQVLQAAGRVIRSAEDRGVVVLVDDRYAEPKYRALFPAHWKEVRYARNASLLAETVRNFWKKADEISVKCEHFAK